jgi:hypothetical protein
VKGKRYWFHCAACGREDYWIVLGGDGSLIVPPGKRLLCRECDNEESDEIEADF